MRAPHSMTSGNTIRPLMRGPKKLMLGGLPAQRVLDLPLEIKDTSAAAWTRLVCASTISGNGIRAPTPGHRSVTSQGRPEFNVLHSLWEIKGMSLPDQILL